jgi:hypothetical protein
MELLSFHRCQGDFAQVRTFVVQYVQVSFRLIHSEYNFSNVGKVAANPWLEMEF